MIDPEELVVAEIMDLAVHRVRAHLLRAVTFKKTIVRKDEFRKIIPAACIVPSQVRCLFRECPLVRA